jgi:ATP-binding cassette, subfamily B, bacterial
MKIKGYRDYLNILKTAVESVRISWQASRWLTSGYLATRLLNGLLPVIQIWIGKNILDQLANSITAEKVIDVNLVLLYLLAGLVVAIIDNVLLTIRFFLISRIHDTLTKYVQTQIMKQSLRLDMSYFESAEFYNQYEKVRNQIDYRLPNSLLDTGELLNLIVVFVSLSLVLINIHWLLFPIIILINLPVLLWGMGYSLVTHDLGSSHLIEGRKANYLADLATDKVSAKEVKLFNFGDYLLKKYVGFFEKVLNENWALSKKQFSGAFFKSSFSDIVYYFFYIWVVFQALARRLTIGDVTLYIQSFSQSSRALSDMLSFINSLYESSLYISDYQKFMSLDPVIKDIDNPLPLNNITSIKFENVYFRYKETLPFVLKDVSFEINENQNIAIVGENGTGKTTIIKLLMRFYDVTKGRILINGKDLRDYKISDLWNQFGTIFQDFEKYHLSVRENIGFGQIEKINKMELISTAAKKSSAHEFIQKLSSKYETTLGTRFEGGTDLSLGQWQKIAIARAFLRDSSVLVLDEPTASLDAKAEYEIFEKFIKLVENKIAILISHRFSTVRLADKIIVIENGKVVETGSHEKLIKAKGRYAEMFNLQAEGYK